MRNLIEFIARHYHWALFLLLETISISLLCKYNSYQSAAWTSTANTVAGSLYSLDSEARHYLFLSSLNEDLTQRNVYLERRLGIMQEELLKHQVDTGPLQRQMAASLANYRTIPAKVVQNSISERDNLITIDKGYADGIHKDMGVVSGKGIVGIVYLVGKHYSVVISALSSKTSISCGAEGKGYFGYLKWYGGASNMAYVDEVPRHARLKLYDRIVTSGYSSVFPPGIAVGKILHVRNSPDGISYRLQIQLYTDFANLRDVCVVEDPTMKERLDIMRAAQDSLKTLEQKE